MSYTISNADEVFDESGGECLRDHRPVVGNAKCLPPRGLPQHIASCAQNMARC